jgi:glycerophosphoryl diester phosphodiesterase
LNRSTGRTASIYLELKAPRWHAAQGHDMIAPVLAVLRQHGYEQTPEQVMLQCFDDATLKRLHSEFAVAYPLVQLIGDNSWGEDSEVDYEQLQTPAGLQEIARYARAIGPWIMQVYLGKTADGKAALSTLVTDAHSAGLLVHPYTVRSDQLPPGIADHDELLDILLLQAGVDGLFTDFPDRMRAFLQRRQR